MSSSRSATLRAVLLALGLLLTLAAVCALDLSMPRGHAAAPAYVLAILAAGLGRRRHVVVVVGAISLALTIVVSPFKAIEDTAVGAEGFVFGRVLSVMLIAVSTALVLFVLSRDQEILSLGRELKRAEASRETDRRMLAAASEVSQIGTWSMDAGDHTFEGSETVSRIIGQAPDFRPDMAHIMSHIPPADAERIRKALDEAWTAGVPFREEVQMIFTDGKERWVVAMGEPVYDGEGRVARLHGTLQDITKWRQAELSATAQSERFAQLTRSLPIIVWTAKPDGMLDFVNEALVDFTGQASANVLLDQWKSLVHPDDMESATQAWESAIAWSAPYDTEFRIRRADGEYLWHHVAAQPEFDTDGRVVRWWGSAINVDSPRRLRIEAEDLAADRETILESMNDGVYALDREYRIIYANKSAESILGFTRQELVDHVIWELFPTSRTTAAADLIARALEHSEAGRTTYFSDVLDAWLDLSVTPSAVGVTVFLRDVTDIKVMADQLSQSQRLEAVGQLTGGIAHDFNNLLTVVLGGADALIDDESVAGEARDMAAMIAEAAERGAELTHRLLAFARRQPLEPKAINLAERLHGLEPLLSRTLGENISMSVRPAEGAPVAEVDPGQYDNAVLNLAINARDAMPKGGTLTIEVGHVTLDEDYASAQVELAPGEYVVTTVSDTGDGIPQEDLGKLFDPFFTTKGSGKGSGLGLAMVWGFVKQSEGHVTVYSEVGVGSSFKLYLPTASAASESAGNEPPLRTRRAASGRILVAEDDALVRRFAVDRLRKAGYEVVEAASGPEALAALDTMDRLDLLFTDVIMPGGMTGRELADAVLEARPGTPVLYASGYTQNVVIHHGRLDPGVVLLDKPYSAHQLLDRVGETIAPQSPEASP